jgi:hypothetical protein
MIQGLQRDKVFSEGIRRQRAAGDHWSPVQLENLSGMRCTLSW